MTPKTDWETFVTKSLLGWISRIVDLKTTGFPATLNYLNLKTCLGWESCLHPLVCKFWWEHCSLGTRMRSWLHRNNLRSHLGNYTEWKSNLWPSLQLYLWPNEIYSFSRRILNETDWAVKLLFNSTWTLLSRHTHTHIHLSCPVLFYCCRFTVTQAQ